MEDEGSRIQIIKRCIGMVALLVARHLRRVSGLLVHDIANARKAVSALSGVNHPRLNDGHVLNGKLSFLNGIHLRLGCGALC